MVRSAKFGVRRAGREAEFGRGTGGVGRERRETKDIEQELTEATEGEMKCKAFLRYLCCLLFNRIFF